MALMGDTAFGALGRYREFEIDSLFWKEKITYPSLNHESREISLIKLTHYYHVEVLMIKSK